MFRLTSFAIALLGITNVSSAQDDRSDAIIETNDLPYSRIPSRFLQAIPSECLPAQDALKSCFELYAVACACGVDSSCTGLVICDSCTDVVDPTADDEEAVEDICQYLECCPICNIEELALYSCIFEYYTGSFSCSGGRPGGGGFGSSSGQAILSNTAVVRSLAVLVAAFILGI